MKRVEITDEHREWLKENYAHLSNKQCRKHIGCGYDRLKKLVAELGLQWRTEIKSKGVKVKKCLSDQILDGNYCQDCKRYIANGICGKTGKDIGALWQKKCFEK